MLLDSSAPPAPSPADSPPSYDRTDWQGGYASQPEEFDYWLDSTEIEGTLPPDLVGTLFRNGPGLLAVNGQAIAHPFDGDGLIAQFTFHQGRVHFRNRYVRTEGYLAERAAGKILYRGVFGTQRPGGWWANLFDLKLKNIANTNVIYWGNKLLALWEAAEPHRLDPRTLETLGIDRLDGLLAAGEAFSAHPRVDPGSGESGPRLVNFAVRSGLSSEIRLFEFDPSGQLLYQSRHTLPGFAFLHDFAITPHWYVFFQNPVQFNPLPFVLGLRSASQCIRFNPQQPTRAILIRRPGIGDQPGDLAPENAIKIIETNPCFVFHHANAFEDETGAVVIESICYDSFPTIDPAQSFLDINFEELPAGQLWRYRLDPVAGTAERHLVEGRCCEFPSLHPDLVGRPHRYLYLGAAHHDRGNAPLQALLKLDRHSGDRQIFSLAPRGFVTEPVFVPRPATAGEPTRGEDDGWVLVLAYQGDRQASDLLIFDARDLTPGPVARLKLRHHLPYGLHGSFTPTCFVDRPSP